MKKAKLLLKLWLPVIFWCSLLFYLSSIPNLKTAQNPFWDEIIRSSIHFVFYAVLYLLFFRALNYQKEEKIFWWPLIFSCLYGLSDEIHQHFVPTRTFQLKDLMVNSFGAGLGGFLVWKSPSQITKKMELLGLIFLPLVITNTGMAYSETVVKTEVSGKSATVKTEIVNIVNEKETKIESNKPGEIRVELKDGKVEVESEGEASPTVTINKEIDNIQIEENEKQITIFLKKVFSRLQSLFFSWFGAVPRTDL